MCLVPPRNSPLIHALQLARPQKGSLATCHKFWHNKEEKEEEVVGVGLKVQGKQVKYLNSLIVQLNSWPSVAKSSWWRYSQCMSIMKSSAWNEAVEFNPLTPILLPDGYSYEASWVRPGYAFICNFWHPGTLALSLERQSARMSKITNEGLTRSGIGCFLLYLLIWQQLASKG